jgi:outer membrane protein OmpU
MNKYTKAGLSALAGSLVAVSAAQADWTVSGAGKMSYTQKGGKTDSKNDGGRFGMDRSITIGSSMEMDNGWAVSSSYTIDVASESNSSLTVDMGAMGAIAYNMVDGALGISKIDDTLPSADEETWNGFAAGIANGRVKHSTATGFNYSNTVSDMVTVNVGLVPQGSSNRGTGAVGQTGAGTDETHNSQASIALTMTPMDGLTVYAGTGEGGAAATDAGTGKNDDLQVLAATYAYGPVSVGYSDTEIDSDTTSRQYDTTGMSIAYAINDNLSISYAERTVDRGSSATDEEQSGFSIGYSMGGMTIKAHSNAIDSSNGVSGTDHEHTEIAVSFAF